MQAQMETLAKPSKKRVRVTPTIKIINDAHIFNRSNPIVLGIEVLEGEIFIGSLLKVGSREIGRITGLEKEKFSVNSLTVGQLGCVKIDSDKSVGYDFEVDELITT